MRHTGRCLCAKHIVDARDADFDLVMEVERKAFGRDDAAVAVAVPLAENRLEC